MKRPHGMARFHQVSYGPTITHVSSLLPNSNLLRSLLNLTRNDELIFIAYAPAFMV
ncbi:MAG TPA: hypothetical protein VN372_15410 [Methanospirillum sp.]|nr:hypothetical protein [Methanospirillum sp.]